MFTLVAAGGTRPQLRDARPLGLVHELGPVPDELLPGLYAGACAFVLPSLHEGFGLTAVEAMASGVPVLCGRAGALPETCGDGARYADPRDPAAIASELRATIGDDALAARGIERAARYSWARTLREVDALVSELLA